MSETSNTSLPHEITVDFQVTISQLNELCTKLQLPSISYEEVNRLALIELTLVVKTLLRDFLKFQQKFRPMN